MNILTSAFFVKLLFAAFKGASPAIFALVRNFVADLRSAADKTPNVWDDILCDILEDVLSTLSA